MIQLIQYPGARDTYTEFISIEPPAIVWICTSAMETI